MEMAIEFGRYAPVAEVVLHRGLRFADDIEPLSRQMGTKRHHVDIHRPGSGNRLFFGEDEAERVVEILQLRGRGFDRGSGAANPYSAVVSHRLEPALARHFDPMHDAAGCLPTVAVGPNRHVAAVLQEVRQTLANTLGIAPHADDVARVVDA